MTRQYHFILLTILIFVSGILQSQDKTPEFPVLKGTYLGQKPPGMTAEVFAQGIISTEKFLEAGCTLTPDGKYLFFTFFKSDSDADIYWVDAKIIDQFKPKIDKVKYRWINLD